MKGISYITDEKNKKKAVVIDLKTIEHNDEDVHEFIDVLVAESRKYDEKISWEDAKKILRKKASFRKIGHRKDIYG
ncbi:MAG TPA: hypothetical protein VN026_09990 [Bacteroidia bacterium]|jgi:hypothetical protein|nr:hypothetical protein [Bacteroidia bacterium]